MAGRGGRGIWGQAKRTGWGQGQSQNHLGNQRNGRACQRGILSSLDGSLNLQYVGQGGHIKCPDLECHKVKLRAGHLPPYVYLEQICMKTCCGIRERPCPKYGELLSDDQGRPSQPWEWLELQNQGKVEHVHREGRHLTTLARLAIEGGLGKMTLTTKQLGRGYTQEPKAPKGRQVQCSIKMPGGWARQMLDLRNPVYQAKATKDCKG